MNTIRIQVSVAVAVVCLGMSGCSRPSREPALRTGQPHVLKLCSPGDGILGNRLGVLTPGELFADLKRDCPQLDTTSVPGSEAEPRTVAYVRTAGTDSIELEFVDDSGGLALRAITITAGGTSDEKGVSVGTKFSALRARYPVLGFGENEGQVFAWPLPDRGVSFGLSAHADSIAPDGNWDTAMDRVPDTVKVTEIVLRRVVRRR